MPTIVSSARDGLKGIGGGAGGAQLRTERDMPMTVVLGGSLLLAHVPGASRPGLPTQGNFLVAVLIVIFGFFFATVSSRITGLIGSSSNPISGMTIATLIITCLIFVALGWTGDVYAPIALSVGAIVCIAAANAGNTSQDLKTGYIVGATPDLPADRPGHRRHHLGVRHRLDGALPAPGVHASARRRWRRRRPR